MTSTDRELLELAAKAAGIKALRCPDGVLRDCTGMSPRANIFAAKPWNPLQDDGDALRLAIAADLGIEVMLSLGETRAGDGNGDVAIERHGDDMFYATRRAIVRAAAEIGRPKP